MLSIKRVNVKNLFTIICLFIFIGCSTSNVSHDNFCPCKLLNDDTTSKLILVKPYDVSYAKVILLEKKYESSDNPIWHQVALFTGRIGRNGVVDADYKKEGDGKTPRGVYDLKQAFGINKIGLKYPYRVLDGTEYWVDDVLSKHYNTMQIVKEGETPEFNSSEHLIDEKIAYQYAMVIDYNNPPVAGKGSAIFLHVEKNKPTAGCVAVSKENMIRILNWIDYGKTKILIK